MKDWMVWDACKGLPPQAIFVGSSGDCSIVADYLNAEGGPFGYEDRQYTSNPIEGAFERIRKALD